MRLQANPIEMKYFSTALIVFFASLGFANAQCDADKYVNECIPKLSDGFNYLKSYKIDGLKGDRDKVEYSYVFTKGTQYMISLCSGANAGDVVVDLYDSQRNKVASSMVDGKLASLISFPCRATGIYYLSFRFNESSEFCAASALGFRR